MTKHPSPDDATVEKCLILGHGFHETDRPRIEEILAKVDHRFIGLHADRVQLELLVKDRDHRDQKVTFEAGVAGAHIVATAEDEDLWTAVAHVRDEFLRQFNDWSDTHRR